MSIDEKFWAAANIVQKMPKTGPVVPTNDEKLLFYSLYKQATEGTNKTAQPGFLNFVDRAKWEAWRKLGEMSSDEAKKKYISLVKEIVDKMSKVMDVNEWLQKIDPTLPEKLTLIMAE
ncbi:acyl CoA binding protein [Loa loa]|uniref:Acyl CoA binding protein n=1 Tax=Loa loa TaxID=7209 RepID=A0A1I7V6H2_LOALO|nr:acyl CoA binding protein [Loa loa]EFO20691.1 acyl CoA binding protein [Loa loa]